MVSKKAALAIHLLSICLAALLFRPDLILSRQAPVGTLIPDSFHFIEFALRLVGVDFQFPQSGSAWAPATEFRTPGYPALLAPLMLLVGSNQWVTAVLFTHLWTWLVALSLLVLLLRKELPAPLLALSFVVASYIMRPYFSTALSEWSIFVALTTYFAFLYHCLLRRTLSSLLLLSFATSFCILVRPDYLFLLVALPLVGRTILATQPLKITFIAIGALPLLLWLSFNYSRFGRPTLAPMEGWIMAMASPLGPIAAQDSDAAELRDLIALLREKGQFATSEELRDLAFGGTTYSRIAGSNIDLAMQFQQDRSLPWTQMNSIMSAYSRRTLTTYLFRYASVVCFGMISLLWAIPIIALLAALTRTLGTERPLCRAALGMIFIHLLHTGVVAVTVIMRPRYFLPSLSALLFACIALAFKQFIERRAAPMNERAPQLD